MEPDEQSGADAFGTHETIASDSRSHGEESDLQFPVEHWDRYEFVSVLGKGGMGVVFKARDRRLQRIVALKFIRSSDPEMVTRFQREARAQARIDHPAICKVYEVGEVEGKTYIAMQFVDGKSLEGAFSRLRLPEKVQLIRDAAEAIHEAHRQGIIHRDLLARNKRRVKCGPSPLGEEAEGERLHAPGSGPRGLPGSQNLGTWIALPLPDSFLRCTWVALPLSDSFLRWTWVALPLPDPFLC